MHITGGESGDLLASHMRGESGDLLAFTLQGESLVTY